MAYLLESEFRNEGFEFLLLCRLVEVFAELEYGHDIILNCHVAKDRGLLGKVTHTELGTAIHRHFGDFHIIEEDPSGEGLDDTHNHVKGGCFTCTIGTEKTDNLSLLYTDAYFFDNSAGTVYFDNVFGSELHF